MRAPEVTVVITAYKLERCLPRALDELLAQTFQDFEILIWDDCSPDGTLPAARAYEAKHPEKIRVFTQETNTGRAARLRNVALDSGEMRGRYVIFLDGDDRVEPEFMEKLIVAADAADADVTVCAFDREDAETGRRSPTELRWLRFGIHPEQGDLAYLNTALWNKLIRRERLDGLRVPDLQTGEDALFLFSLYDRCARFAGVAEPLIHYRVHAASAITKTGFSDAEAFATAMKNTREQMRTKRMRDTLAVSAFVHIGLSLAFRATGTQRNEHGSMGNQQSEKQSTSDYNSETKSAKSTASRSTEHQYESTISANSSAPITPRAYASWASGVFKRQYSSFRGEPFLRARVLLRRGRAGISVFIMLTLYRLGLAALPLCIARRFPALMRW